MLQGARLVGLAMLVSAYCFGADVSLWVDDSSGEIGTVNVSNGAVTLIGNTGLGSSLTDIAFSPSGNLYGVTNTALYSINKTNAATALIGSLSPSIPIVAGTAIGNVGANALVFSDTGTLYTAAGGLYTVNPSNGADTLVGSLGNGYVSGGDLAFVGGQLYLSDTNNQLLTVNTSTGAASVVGNMGVANMFGLASPDGTTLYGVAGTSVYTIDPATGSATLDASWGTSSGLGQAFGEAFITEAGPSPITPTSTPEPASICLASVGALLSIWFGRRRVSRSRQLN